MKDDQAVEELPDDFKVKNSGGRESVLNLALHFG